MRLVIGSIVLALVVASAEPVLAQRQGRGGQGGIGGGAGGGVGQLLNNPQVATELELSDDQKAEIQKIMEGSRTGMRDLFTGLRDLPQEEREKKMAELRTKMEATQSEIAKKVDGVLLDHQKTRLKQISIQIQGNRALTDKEVIAALKLTEEQQAELKKLADDLRTARQTAFADGVDRQVAQTKFVTAEKENQEKIAAVLTSEQKAKLEELKGKKFELIRGEGGRGGANAPGGQRRQRGAAKTNET